MNFLVCTRASSCGFLSCEAVSTFLFICLLLQKTGSFVSRKSEELQLFVSPLGMPLAGAREALRGLKPFVKAVGRNFEF